MTNSFHIVGDDCHDGIRPDQDSQGFYLSVGHPHFFPVVKEIVGKQDGLITEMSLWADADGNQILGARKTGDRTVFVRIDGALGVCAYNADAFRLIARGSVHGSSRRFVSFSVGEIIVVQTADGALHGLEATEGDILPFEVEQDRHAEIECMLAYDEALYLASLRGRDLESARRVGCNQLLDHFEDFGNLYEDAVGALVQAFDDRALSAQARERFADVACRYGKVTVNNGRQLVFIYKGVSRTMYLEAGEGLSRNQRESRKAANRAERLAKRPVGLTGVKTDNHSKKKAA